MSVAQPHELGRGADKEAHPLLARAVRHTTSYRNARTLELYRDEFGDTAAERQIRQGRARRRCCGTFKDEPHHAGCRARRPVGTV